MSSCCGGRLWFSQGGAGCTPYISALEDGYKQQRSPSSSYEPAPDMLKQRFPAENERRHSAKRSDEEGLTHSRFFLPSILPPDVYPIFPKERGRDGTTTALYVGSVEGWGKNCESVSATERNVADVPRSSVREEVAIASKDEHHTPCVPRQHPSPTGRSRRCSAA